MKANKFLRKIRKSGTSLSINIPLEVLEILDLKEKDIVEVEIRKVENER